MASLAACVAFYARRFLSRHGLPEEGLAVNSTFTMSQDRPARVAAIRLEVRTGTPVPAERMLAFRKVIEHCTVHNTLTVPPDVQIVVADRAVAGHDAG